MRKIFIVLLVALVLAVVAFPIATASAQTAGLLDHVVIAPNSVTLLTGASQQFTAQGQDTGNVTIPDLTYSWAVVAGGGIISESGLFTAGDTPGIVTSSIQITAVQGSIIKHAYATVTVTTAPGPLDHVVIVPTSTTLLTGVHQQFTAQGQDANNIAIPDLTYSWAVVAGGGTISTTGLFIAGDTTGTFPNTIQITAVQGSIVKTASASLIINACPADDEEDDEDSCTPPGWAKGKKNGWKDGTPPGWSKGNKKGWVNGMPPGLAKKMAACNCTIECCDQE